MLYNSVIVMPIESFHQGAMFRGGPLWPCYAWQWKARHARGWLPIPRDAAPSFLAEPTTTIPQAIWCGPIAFHFGHAVADFGMRIAESAYSGLQCPLLFAMESQLDIDPPEYFWQILRHLKIETDRVVIVRSPVKVEKLYVYPQSEVRGGAGPSRRHLDLMDRITGSAANPATNTKVYVSRSRLHENHNFPVGQIAAESYIENALTQAGFTTIHPEEMPVDQQLEAYKNASTLIFSEGSALHGLQLLGRIHAKLGIISRRKGKSMPTASFRCRVQQLTHINAVHGMIYSLRANGRADKTRAISVLDQKHLIESLTTFGVDLTGVWDAGAYRRARNDDIKAWAYRMKALGQHPRAEPFIRQKIRTVLGKGSVAEIDF